MLRRASSAMPDPSLRTVSHTSEASGCTGGLWVGLWKWRPRRSSSPPDASTPVYRECSGRTIYHLSLLRQLGVQPCCGADASIRVTSSRIIAGGVPARYTYVILSRSEFVRSMQSLDQHPVYSCGELSMAEVRPVPHESDWTMCYNCPGQTLHTAWDTSNPHSAGQRSTGWSAGVHGNIWPSVSRGSGLGSRTPEN